MWLEPAMLCRPPLTSPRRGWMELPDVGDFCQVVIQKWMNHILTEIPLHPLYVWYDIQSFGELFLFILWIRLIWLQRQGRRLSSCTICVPICSERLHSLMILLRNVPYVVDMLRNILYAIDKLRYVSFVSDMLQLLYAPSVRNLMGMIGRTIVILLLMILCLRNRIFCFVFWNCISLEIVPFWYGYVSHLLSSLCSPRLLINFSG